ncbi:MAG: helix-turn-helix domain-containing protein [Leptothrix ochracea]|uniref:helix-turn-helix domain-containing protein n=1 Tax=Leptothrix ochracea TaxID=735331 RepID=UPI0034E26DCE
MKNDEADWLPRLLIQARVSGNLTQTEVANRIGKPQSFVSKYESGERRLDVLELIRICRVLGISASEIVDQLEKCYAQKDYLRKI